MCWVGGPNSDDQERLVVALAISTQYYTIISKQPSTFCNPSIVSFINDFISKLLQHALGTHITRGPTEGRISRVKLFTKDQKLQVCRLKLAHHSPRYVSVPVG